MNLYHLTQDEVDDYDTYSDCVVAAESAEEAVHTHPNAPSVRWDGTQWVRQIEYTDGRLPSPPYANGNDEWPTPDKVKAVLIGKAADDVRAGVVCVSFHTS